MNKRTKFGFKSFVAKTNPLPANLNVVKREFNKLKDFTLNDRIYAFVTAAGNWSTKQTGHMVPLRFVSYHERSSAAGHVLANVLGDEGLPFRIEARRLFTQAEIANAG